MKTILPPISILHISDFHVLPTTGETLLGIDTEYYFKRILKAAHERHGKFDLIVASGDLAQQPCVDSYQRIHKVFSKYDTKTICLPGNHDDYALMTWLLNKDKVSCEKQLLLENWQIICLNSKKPNDAGGKLTALELDFLEKTLKKKQRPHVMVVVHHHCIPSESEWLDTMLIENSREFLDCLKDYSEVKLIVTGHIHQSRESSQQGLTILSTPSTCFQFKPKCKNFTLDSVMPGYRVIELSTEGAIKTNVHRLSGDQNELENNQNGYH
ncbi:MAG: 3',5'-cyclic-AMP phosphodiesterase [Methylococcales bacterium]|nr:3',5'-cyclic-AMP phosphodiesterase [Methylococcales bacterium]